MSDIQRMLLKDEGDRAEIRNHHTLGLVFLGLAGIPMLMPFRVTDAGIGTVISIGGAAALASFGLGCFLWRRVLVIDFIARRVRTTHGFWPFAMPRELAIEGLRSVELVEKSNARRPSFEVCFRIEGDGAPLVFFESADRNEAQEVRAHWAARLAPDPSPLGAAA